jgi:UDP-N-acetylglucosamine 2-epimerase (non-hydrolysing)
MALYKIISVVGARPNFMKIAPLSRVLRRYEAEFEHIIVHTGQHYDEEMSNSFFRVLDIPAPDYNLNIGSGSHAEQTGKVMIEFEKVCMQEKPDFVMVVGDVNSTVACTLTAKKLGIPVGHIEAGLRSYDMAMPEELNRKVTDSICDYAFISEPGGYDNLLREGWDKERLFLVGNTMIDSLFYILPKMTESNILSELKVKEKEYCLLTFHRPRNVDNREKLTELVATIAEIAEKIKIIFPIHPRTKHRLEEFGLEKVLDNPNIICTKALNYLDFTTLIKGAKFVLTDSGGIQEETTALNIPCLTVRPNTERPITCTEGSNLLLDGDSREIVSHVDKIIADASSFTGRCPALWDGKAAERIVDILKRILRTRK